MPAVAISPVTTSGVSAAYWVAAIESPAFQPEILRPARKYSSGPCEASLRAVNPDHRAYVTKASTSRRSITCALYHSPPVLLGGGDFHEMTAPNDRPRRTFTIISHPDAGKTISILRKLFGQSLK